MSGRSQVFAPLTADLVAVGAKAASAYEGRLWLVDLHARSRVLALDLVQREVRLVPRKPGALKQGQRLQATSIGSEVILPRQACV